MFLGVYIHILTFLLYLPGVTSKLKKIYGNESLRLLEWDATMGTGKKIGEFILRASGPLLAGHQLNEHLSEKYYVKKVQSHIESDKIINLDVDKKRTIDPDGFNAGKYPYVDTVRNVKRENFALEALKPIEKLIKLPFDNLKEDLKDKNSPRSTKDQSEEDSE